MEKKPTTAATMGIIISLVLIVFSLALQFLDLSQNKGLGALQFLLFIVGVVWSVISYAKQLNGNVTFGNAFAYGFRVSAAVTALMVIFTIIFIKFISPEQIDIALQEARRGMEEKNMSDDQIDQGLKLTRKFFVPFAVGGVLFIYLMMGVVASLIGAATAKKNPQSPFVQQA